MSQEQLTAGLKACSTLSTLASSRAEEVKCKAVRKSADAMIDWSPRTTPFAVLYCLRVDNRIGPA
jgi:hypothetical protein